MQSGDPNDLFDAAEQFGKVFTQLAEATLTPKTLVPTYKMLVEGSKPPLPADAKSLALEVAASPRTTGMRVLKRSFHTLKADGPFIFERAEVIATATDRLASSGDPPTPAPLETHPIPPRRHRHRLESHQHPPNPARRRRKTAGPKRSIILLVPVETPSTHPVRQLPVAQRRSSSDRTVTWRPIPRYNQICGISGIPRGAQRIELTSRAISSAVRGLLYTQDVGGSNPSSPNQPGCVEPDSARRPLSSSRRW